MARTLTSEWEAYLKDQLGGTTNIEVKSAFYAGALAMMVALPEHGNRPAALLKEIETFHDSEIPDRQ